MTIQVVKDNDDRRKFNVYSLDGDSICNVRLETNSKNENIISFHMQDVSSPIDGLKINITTYNLVGSRGKQVPISPDEKEFLSDRIHPWVNKALGSGDINYKDVAMVFKVLERAHDVANRLISRTTRTLPSSPDDVAPSGHEDRRDLCTYLYNQALHGEKSETNPQGYDPTCRIRVINSDMWILHRLLDESNGRREYDISISLDNGASETPLGAVLIDLARGTVERVEGYMYFNVAVTTEATYKKDDKGLLALDKASVEQKITSLVNGEESMQKAPAEEKIYWLFCYALGNSARRQWWNDHKDETNTSLAIAHASGHDDVIDAVLERIEQYADEYVAQEKGPSSDRRTI